MARETIKSLKEEIEKLKLQLNTLSEQNSRLIKQADQEFLNSYVYRELSEKVQFLQNYCKTLEKENQRLKDKLEEKTAEIGRLKVCTTTDSMLESVPLPTINEQITEQNRKHAGRKPVFSAEQQMVTLYIRQTRRQKMAITRELTVLCGEAQRCSSSRTSCWYSAAHCLVPPLSAHL